MTLCKAAAPLLPLLCEKVYTALTGEESVHLCDWPDVSAFPDEPGLVREMDRVRDACSVGLSLREAHKLRTRLPLPKVTLAGQDAAAMQPFVHLLQEELNVKAVEFAQSLVARTLDPDHRVEFAQDLTAYGSFRLQVDAKTLGPKLGGTMKDVLAATRSGDWRREGDAVHAAGVTLAPGDYVLQLVPTQGAAAAALSSNDVVLVLDTAVTAELEQEGAARDFTRLVQQARKDAGLHVSDRIELWVAADAATAAALRAHLGYLQEQALAVRVTFEAAPADAFAASGKVGSGAGAEVAFGLKKA